MDDARVRAQLTDEFRTTLDEPLIIAILGDFDLRDPRKTAEAREALKTLADHAVIEETSRSQLTCSEDARDKEIDQILETTSESIPSTDPSSVSGPNATIDLGRLEYFPSTHALDCLSDPEKVERLRVIFSDLKSVDVTLSLRKCGGDVGAAIEELLTIQHLEASGERQKGIDAFFTENDGSPRQKKRGKRPKSVLVYGKPGRAAADPKTPGLQRDSQASSSTGSSETGSSSDGTNPTPIELDSKQMEEVSYIAIRLNLVVSEVLNVYVASDCSLPATIDSFVDAFFHIGLKSTHQSLNSRVDSLRKAYPDVPHRYLPCIADMTETQAHANDISGILQNFYAKANKKQRLVVNYTLAPAPLDIDGPETKKITPAPMYVNRHAQPALARRRISAPPTSTPTSSTPSATPRDPNKWITVRRKPRSAGAGSAAPTEMHSPAMGVSRDAALNAATSAYRKGTSNPLWRQAAAVFQERHAELRRRDMSAEADRAVAVTRTEHSVDLHGVFVADGIRIARQDVRAWWVRLDTHQGIEKKGKAKLARDLGGFTIITGRGIHSSGGRSRLRPAVLTALLEDGWDVQAKTGAFIVTGKR